MRHSHAVCGEEVQSSAFHGEEGVVGEFLGEDCRRRVSVLELVARRNTDEDQTVVSCVENSIGPAIVVGGAPHEHFCFALNLFSVMEHAPLKLPVRSGPCFRSVDVSHEEEIPEQNQSNENYRKTEQGLL